MYLLPLRYNESFFTKASTVVTYLAFGPKLKASPCKLLFFDSLYDNNKYPLRGSKTCCHGLVAFGFLNLIVLFSCQAFIKSGTILSFAQSPPPITFPALTEHILI